MKMYCCARGTFHCQYANEVKFDKLKTKYSIDEDIVVHYIIRDRIHTSSRDWIGIFPRGWSNLQQYLTFEFVVLSPKTSNLSNRSIMFLHTFHREALPNVDYQFVYVSKEIEILGTSSYFRFIVTPNLRPLDRNSNIVDCGVMSDGYSSLIVSPSTSNTGKLLGCSKSFDNIQSHRICRSLADHRNRTCRFCSKSASFTTNRIQFLLLHNEQLVARVGRLARDLELKEAAVKSERMAQAVLTKRLQAYETFVADMLKRLNLTGTIKIKDKMGKEMIVQKVKSKDEAEDKPLPVLEVSMLNQSPESATKINETKEVARASNLFDTVNNEEDKVSKDFAESGFSVKIEPDEGEQNFEVTLSVEKEQSQFDRRISMSATGFREDGEKRCDSYVTKEATGAICQRVDNTCGVTCKIEQPNCVEGKPEDAVNMVHGDKKTMGKLDPVINLDSPKCCCDCHSKTCSSIKKFDNDGVNEWVLQCECDLEVADRMYQMIDNYAEQQRGTMEAKKDGLSAILIKGRNTKFAVIKY
ncbi:tax1-binding protein 1 homolog isoform X1 [Frieseomelitta varia]|uniref:tax1-binding protein 1 homolog isoform X1 n=2 Tax=Frieseomelitta varia TaxID=561572 RepID=UPI001CB6B30F|nr:tax1-binding protein 1 homolog isoform X1 [Frieseomelitta varia]